MQNIKGSCCCGAIQFELIAAPSMMGTCHCSRCRKLGSSTLVFADQAGFNLLQGQEFISKYVPEPPHQYIRTLCKNCGTSLGGIGSGSESFPVPVNSLDDDPILRNQFHVFVASKAAWYEITDEAQQYQENPSL